VVASSLEDLGEDALQQAFERSKPRRPSPREEPAPDVARWETVSEKPATDEPDNDEPADAVSVSE
jgi:hypothetical protein